jgi:hypothetical protein
MLTIYSTFLDHGCDQARINNFIYTERTLKFSYLKRMNHNTVMHLRPNDKRARNTITMIWIMLFLEFCMLGSSYLQYQLLQLVDEGEQFELSVFEANDLREKVIGILYTACYIISGVIFIQWFRRAYYNLGLLGVKLEHTNGWAAGGWFMPVLCLYVPYNIMKELYTKTRILLESKEIPLHGSLTTSAIGWWWGFWIVANVLGQIVFRMSLKAESFEELENVTVLSMYSSAVSIPLAFLALKIVKDYSRTEHLLQQVETPSDEEPGELPAEPVPV